MPRLAVLVLAMFARCAPALLAQSTSASLTGCVTDPSKTRNANASFKAINSSTSLGYKATTNASGEYYLSNLPPGTCRSSLLLTKGKCFPVSEVRERISPLVDFACSIAAAFNSQPRKQR
jgi:hypothetical protein